MRRHVFPPSFSHSIASTAERLAAIMVAAMERYVATKQDIAAAASVAPDVDTEATDVTRRMQRDKKTSTEQLVGDKRRCLFLPRSRHCHSRSLFHAREPQRQFRLNSIKI